MSDDTDNKDENAAPEKSAKKAFAGGKKRDDSVLFMEDEVDIYCNKITNEAFIFHAIDIDYKTLERMEYNHDTFRAKVFIKNGQEIDLGIKIQWLIRPYFSKAKEVQIIRTVDGEPIDGTFIPLSHRRTT